MNKIEISKEKFDSNLLFYTCLKTLNSSHGLSETQINQTLILREQISNINIFKTVVNEKIIDKIKGDKQESILELFALITNEQELKIFSFALSLIKLKPLLLEYSKIIDFFDINQPQELLSLKTDSMKKREPYAFRVNGALITISFFELINLQSQTMFSSSYSNNFINRLFDEYKSLSDIGIESNTIFGIIFQESISQSIKSTAGSSLEELVQIHLSNIGIVDVQKRHDKNHNELEYDHFFKIENKAFGVSTKRTLRERYKQFKKLPNSEADIFIHITSGLDLNEAKAEIITNNDFGCYIFVFPEIYNNSNYMKNNKKIFSTTELKLEVLKKLV